MARFGVVALERRKSSRFRLRCNVTFTWRNEHGVLNATTGIARDISVNGMFVSSQDSPWIGSMAEVTVEMPSRGPFGQAMQLHGIGRVVRVVRDGEGSGFAMAGTPCWTMTRSRKQTVARSV